MWFCIRCKIWYHYDCCDTKVFTKSYHQLEDLIEMPLLRGGPFGLVGTAPLVFSAVKVMQKVQMEGGSMEHDWRELMDEVLEDSAERYLEEMMEGPLDSEIKCPCCDSS